MVLLLKVKYIWDIPGAYPLSPSVVPGSYLIIAK